MNIEEFINKFENDIEFKNKIILDLNNQQSNHSKEDLLEHKKQIQELYYNLSIQELFDTLEEYSLLEENWDGYNADKPNQKIINNAKQFLLLLMKTTINFPKLMISSSGHIGLYFQLNKENYIEIEIEENCYSYFVDTKTKGLFGKDDLSLDIIDEDLINSINSMYNLLLIG